MAKITIKMNQTPYWVEMMSTQALIRAHKAYAKFLEEVQDNEEYPADFRQFKEREFAQITTELTLRGVYVAPFEVQL
jgi:hypothetical protein